MPIEADAGEMERFLAKDTGRPFVLVQLLRLAEDGRERYLKYSAAALPVVRSVGGQVLYAGECVQPLSVAPGQAWDGVVVTRYPSRAAYAQMLQDPAYQKIAPLRSAALREAALFPMDDWPGR